MEFKDVIKKMEQEDDQAIVSVAIWRTSSGINVFTKGSEFEAIGMLSYIVDSLKDMIHNQLKVKAQPTQNIVIPNVRFSPNRRQ